MEHRRFHRITFITQGDLVHHGISYRGRLENISLRGALISSNECIMIPLGETCTLSVGLEGELTPLTLTVEVVHSFFSMVGVRFVGFEGDAEQRIFELMKKLTSEPDTLMKEWQELLAHAGQKCRSSDD